MNYYVNSEFVSKRGLSVDSKPKRIKEKPEYINVQEWGKKDKKNGKRAFTDQKRI